MITESRLEELYGEKLTVHSRENERETMCDYCKEESDTCGKALANCIGVAEGDNIDAAYESWRDEQ